MWKAMEQDFACINAMNVSHAATDAMFAPYAHHNNGAIDFVHIGSKETNSSKITKVCSMGPAGKLPMLAP
jgi:hypothetical protein